MTDLATTFDYATLSRDARLVVTQKTTEIRDRMGRAAQNIVEIGERLLAVKDTLGHGKFGAWLSAEFQWSYPAAARMMQVAEQFKSINLRDLTIAPSALYLLASNTTPPEVRKKFIAEAAAGKPVTHADVKAAVAKPAPDITFGTINTDNEPTAADDSTDADDDEEEKRDWSAPEGFRKAEPGEVDDAAARVARRRENRERAIERCETTGDIGELLAAGTKFGCILADPPWQYGNQATRASTDNHYPTMTIEDIAALPIGELAAERSHLWLWTTNGFLFECPKLFDAWGFEFKSSYVWCKTQMGIGNYLRNAHEFLLLAVRGGLTGAVKDVRSWGEFPRGAHSAKPEQVRHDVIERLSPGPRLELFGRRTVPGWTVFGNQVEKGLLDASGV